MDTGTVLLIVIGVVLLVVLLLLLGGGMAMGGMAMMTGMMIARMDVMVEITSSRILTGMLPAPAVVAVTAGRTASDLTA